MEAILHCVAFQETPTKERLRLTLTLYVSKTLLIDTKPFLIISGFCFMILLPEFGPTDI